MPSDEREVALARNEGGAGGPRTDTHPKREGGLKREF
jgi:hypothetical protein